MDFRDTNSNFTNKTSTVSVIRLYTKKDRMTNT